MTLDPKTVIPSEARNLVLHNHGIPDLSPPRNGDRDAAVLMKKVLSQEKSDVIPERTAPALWSYSQ
jgi:hypothetical protein